ncbi:hypothetical protein [Ensifer sp. YR511]|nr:hypothetical protein [Ensifer sp. YR511]SDO01340.1 hypothetical protein SAMN05216328_14815 [Ensifer sp. YR511]
MISELFLRLAMQMLLPFPFLFDIRFDPRRDQLGINVLLARAVIAIAVT